MTGDAVLATLKADGRTHEIPVVVLSAEASAEAVRRLRTAGALAYLTQPIEVPEILALLDDLLPA
jgi:CheY-like chemotaxis protein